MAQSQKPPPTSHWLANIAEEERIQSVYKRREKNAREAWFNPGEIVIIQERERRLASIVREYNVEPLDAKKILEVGCGTGYWLREFLKWGARPENITGIDLLSERVAEAKRLCPAQIRIDCGSAAKLEYPDASFDLVLQSTVFSSILDPEMKKQVAREMQRVLKPSGLILWYDFHVNNPWNPDVRGIKRAEIRELFANCVIYLQRVTLAPPLARAIAPRSWLLAHLLAKLPLLCTHYLGVIRKNRS
jgi:ubiquinone/menaquinone biosynthesis C-methylase UbiE